MSFTFTCPHCGQKIEAEEEWIGQEAECPCCGKDIVVCSSTPCIDVKNTEETKHLENTESIAQFPFVCPSCGFVKKMNVNTIGTKIICEECAEEVEVSQSEYRVCPFCGEKIKVEAKRCKFCKKSVDSQQSTQKIETSSLNASESITTVKGTKIHGLVGFLLTIPSLLIFLLMKGCTQAASDMHWGDNDLLGDYYSKSIGTTFNGILLLIFILSLTCFILSFYGQSKHCKKTGIAIIISSTIQCILYGFTFNILGFVPGIIFILAGKNSIGNAKSLASTFCSENPCNEKKIDESTSINKKSILDKITRYVCMGLIIAVSVGVICSAYIYFDEHKHEWGKKQSVTTEKLNSSIVDNVNITVKINVADYKLPSDTHRFVYKIYDSDGEVLASSKKTRKTTREFNISVNSNAKIIAKVFVLNGNNENEFVFVNYGMLMKKCEYFRLTEGMELNLSVSPQ